MLEIDVQIKSVNTVSCKKRHLKATSLTEGSLTIEGLEERRVKFPVRV